jgi:hypothetical protein
MTDFKKLLKQNWQLFGLAAIAIGLLTIISAIGGDLRQPGSSYSIAPNGYQAWYQTAIDRGIKIDRWQKSFAQLAKLSQYEEGTTLLQVNPKLERLQLTTLQRQWVSGGNTLAILGITAPAWDIPFRAELASSQGKIEIETTRRFRSQIDNKGLPLDADRNNILSDRSGSVIAQFKLDRGKIIVATTPYLAANTYQDVRANYDLLTELVSQDRQQILVDEYIHGYIDRSSSTDPNTGDVFTYLMKTPLIIFFVNLLLGIIVLVWQQNRRFGKVFIPKLPEIDNSEAYIQALGGVLHQANSSDFVLQNIGRAEQLSWQQKLGLGTVRLVEAPVIITAWEHQTKLPTDDLRFVLQLMTAERRLTPAELTIWLTKIRTIDRQLSRDRL